MSSSFTPAEIDLVKQLREKLVDLDFKQERFGNCEDFYIRALRDYKYNVKDAEECIRKYMKFWHENNLDSIDTWKPDEAVKYHLQHEFCGIDSSGCPISLLPWGHWDLKKIIELGFGEEHDRSILQVLEIPAKELAIQTETKKEVAPGFVILCDLSEFSMKRILGRQAISRVLRLAKILDTYYALNMHVCCLIDAPKAFGYVWKLVNPLFREQLREKLKFCSSENVQDVLKKVNISNTYVPIQYGGEYKVSITYFDENSSQTQTSSSTNN